MFANLEGTSLTDEIFNTTMCLFEETLNARPLIRVNDHPNDLEALTPNNFLLGSSNIAIPFLPSGSGERYTDLCKSFRTTQLTLV